MTVPAPAAEPFGDATEATQADNPFAVVNYEDLVRALARWGVALGRHPVAMLAQLARTAAEFPAIATGRSGVTPAGDDRRFRDSAWDGPVYQRLMQSYLVCRDGAHALVDHVGLSAIDAERARFGLMLVSEALSPTNGLFTNPAVLRRAYESRGASLVRGGRNAVRDVRHNGGMPAQVDGRPFTLGENVAASDGAVVHRTPVFELIQYAPTTAQVAGTPLLLISSQVNKFYIADLAPDRSMVEFTTAQGLPTFAISWRNPEREQADWGFATYMAACKEAVDAVLAISGAERLHLAGICGGGIMVSMLLAHLAATDDERVASGTLMVTHLDQAVQTLASVLVADPVIAAAKRRSRRAGILDGRDTARFFAWLRPNELVWSYVVNNWLLGDDPPQHELLFWNVDNTRLPAQLHVDYLDLYLKNALVHPGALEVLGTPIDLSAVRTDTYLVGGTTDHITPWRGCHRSAALLGGDSQFVLSVGGHVGTIVSAIGNQRARHFAGPVTGDDPDAWSAAAEEHAGSWWPHWAAWLGERSAPPRRAARRLGNRRFPALESAPGSYVL